MKRKSSRLTLAAALAVVLASAVHPRGRAAAGGRDARRSTTPGWPGGATHGLACSSTGVFIPIPAGVYKDQTHHAEWYLEETQHAGLGVREVRRPVQPREVQRQGVGGRRQGTRG